jgi:hypothetical protein
MKTFLPFCILTLGLLLAGLTGCATRQKIDWSARVGNYTFDQAVLDFGPPTKQAKLTDGTLVAEWQTQRGYAQTYYPPAPGYRHRYYSYYNAPVTTYSPDAYLRLTFGPDGVLQAWKKIVM